MATIPVVGVQFGQVSPPAISGHGPQRTVAIYRQTGNIPSALIFATQNQQDLLCRMFGKCLVGGELDNDLGELIGGAGPVAPELFTCLRYDADVSREALIALSLPDVDPEHVQVMASTKYIDAIQKVGHAVEEFTVRTKHFAGF